MTEKSASAVVLDTKQPCHDLLPKWTVLVDGDSNPVDHGSLEGIARVSRAVAKRSDLDDPMVGSWMCANLGIAGLG